MNVITQDQSEMDNFLLEHYKSPWKAVPQMGKFSVFLGKFIFFQKFIFLI